MRTILKLLFTSLAVVITAYLLPGVLLADYLTALWVAVILALVNVFVKPLLILFTIPLTVLTMGLFLLVVNALMIMLTDHFVDGFRVNGFWWALAFSLILSLFDSMYTDLTKKENDR